MTERVTVEQNGERFTLEVPDGTSDADIQSFLSQQQRETVSSQEEAVAPQEPEVSLAPQALNAVKNAVVTPQGTLGPLGQLGEQVTRGGTRDLASIAKILYNNATPAMAGEALLHPVKTAQALGSAYVQGHPWANATLKQGVTGLAGGLKNVGSALVQGAVAPESLMMLPYQMAAYEQEKIRANPNAPEYANNPYAMSYRSQGTANPITQGQAGAQNARNAVANMNTGYSLSPVEARNLLISGDQRTIQLYGGVKKLQALSNPNAINSGYSQELSSLGK
jgi:hypothetical protein